MYESVKLRCFSTDVLGLEQLKLGHDNGGSQDHSRIMYVFTTLNLSE